MNIFRDLSRLPRFRNAIVTTGSFDGVHLGHQKIFALLNRLARLYDGESVVITFDPHPREVIYPKDHSLKLLTSTEEKLECFEAYGINNAVVLPFTIEFSQQRAREYVEDFLIKKFAPKCLVVGYDHRFGLNREGDFQLLKNYSDRGAFDLRQIEKQEVEHIAISSSKIRNAILDCNVDKANALLGRPYRLTGTVIHGEKVGTELGYPTANLKIESANKLIPPDGVYAALVQTSAEKPSGGMLYIGKRPTIQSEDPRRSIEVNLLDFNGDLYDQSVKVDLIGYVRPDRKLDNHQALSDQIAQDEKTVRDMISTWNPKEPKAEVAIVALNYNGTRVLPQYLPSFMKMPPGRHEIYVADNGSTDNSLDILANQFPDVKLIRLDRNYGFADGYNRALERLDHTYFAFVNTDVELTADWLNPILKVLDSDASIAACQPKILDARDRSKFEYAGAAGGMMDALGYAFCAGRILYDLEYDAGQYDSGHELFWSSGAAMVVRAEVFEMAGGFDKDFFAHQEEIDLCWTIRQMGYRIVSVPESVVYHEGGATLPYHNPTKVFLNFRNNLVTLIKHLPRRRLISTLFLRVFLDALAVARFATRGELRNALAIPRAYFALAARWSTVWRKRRALAQRVARHKRGRPNQGGYYNKSILFDYYVLGNRKYSELRTEPHGIPEAT